IWSGLRSSGLAKAVALQREARFVPAKALPNITCRRLNAAKAATCLAARGRYPQDRGCARGTDDQMRRRGRPPRRPFARELAAFRRLVRLPTSAAALTSATLGFLPMTDGLTVATLTFADDAVPG